MTNSVVSYSIPPFVKDFVTKQSQELSMSKGKFLAYLVESWQKQQDEIALLKTYLDMSVDKDFQQWQINESEEDLLAELAVNPDLKS